MTKKYGVKEKDLVVAHVVNQILTGKLRTGDRLDRNEIAEQLGFSRVPVQEAVAELEQIGLLATRYHRGAFVERFDEGVVREHHEIYGALNGIASARAAREHRPAIVDQLRATLAALHTSRESRAFHEHTWRYRETINAAYAGPRLKAAIRASTTFMPRSFWTAYLGSHDELLPFYVAETAAIGDGDADAARVACAGRAELMGRIMLSELIRRTVLRPEQPPVEF
ncbi:putative HTH-type transcriptional regulator [Mycobacterium antarcticum]|uniref:GntR family transcriptional regulator n=1 Tax=unclassified Mycolicibacterium TaxID=2636767 RepID=UPI00238BDAB7|nr:MULTISPECIES: GntR family transcriptional regulator [unclassified Mycolicibacterium]BDX35318.1 putative HTH-type transcriptional regulator [Mycolicibacterium sp. TUM20985]GLP78492.1 putative HTH-type transcriptional regulator [Mycolicibacterium sp. TUM20983]GLP81555.1 putative HTH-type transcriptional regulator [Mycolicibacterium sp. TUM20984]